MVFGKGDRAIKVSFTNPNSTGYCNETFFTFSFWTFATFSTVIVGSFIIVFVVSCLIVLYLEAYNEVIVLEYSIRFGFLAVYCCLL